MCFSAIAAIGSAAIGASASRRASKAQTKSADRQIDLQEDVYNDQKELFSPFREAGVNALAAFQSELGLGEAPEGYQGFKAAPGYQHRLKEGLDAVQAGVGARHGLNSGASLKALTEYGQNYASAEYGKHLNRLAGLTDMGQSSSAMTASAANNYASGASNALANMGNAQAAGAIGVGNALNQGIANGIGLWQYKNGLNAHKPGYVQ